MRNAIAQCGDVIEGLGVMLRERLFLGSLGEGEQGGPGAGRYRQAVPSHNNIICFVLAVRPMSSRTQMIFSSAGCIIWAELHVLGSSVWDTQPVFREQHDKQGRFGHVLAPSHPRLPAPASGLAAAVPYTDGIVCLAAPTHFWPSPAGRLCWWTSTGHHLRPVGGRRRAADGAGPNSRRRIGAPFVTACEHVYARANVLASARGGAVAAALLDAPHGDLRRRMVVCLPRVGWFPTHQDAGCAAGDLAVRPDRRCGGQTGRHGGALGRRPRPCVAYGA